MSSQKQGYSRYLIVRGHAIFWKNDPLKGDLFREVFITSDEWSSMAGAFQVYAIEGESERTQNGFLAISAASKKLIFDGDFLGFEAADMKYKELRADAIKGGFVQKSKKS